MNTVSMLLRYYMRNFEVICNVNEFTVESGKQQKLSYTCVCKINISVSNSHTQCFLILSSPSLYHRDAGERSLWMTLCLSMKRIICYYQLQPAKLNFGQCCWPKLSLSWQILGMFSHLMFRFFLWSPMEFAKSHFSIYGKCILLKIL